MPSVPVSPGRAGNQNIESSRNEIYDQGEDDRTKSDYGLSNMLRPKLLSISTRLDPVSIWRNQLEALLTVKLDFNLSTKGSGILASSLGSKGLFTTPMKVSMNRVGRTFQAFSV